MRLPQSRGRKQSLWRSNVPIAVSFLLNFLFGAAIFILCTRNIDTGSLDLKVSQVSGIAQNLREEIKNISSSVREAQTALRAEDAKLVAAREHCVQLAKLDEDREATLQHETATMKTALTLSTRNQQMLAAQIRSLTSKENKPPDVPLLWLTIGIPTIPRRNNTDYLTRTLSSLFEELPLDKTDLLFKRVKVLIMNNRPGSHEVWKKLKQRIEEGQDAFAEKGRLYAEFVDNPGNVKDPTPHAPDPDDNNNPSNRPGREVRRQTGDLISLLEMAQPLSSYYAFMEDDFRVCPNMLRILSYAVRKLNTVHGSEKWLGLRFSYGMNGILIRNSDLESLTQYLRKYMARQPPDLLFAEWLTGRRPELRKLVRGRKLAVYRHNLLDHIGARSSFTVRMDRPQWPGCFHPMSQMWSLSPKEKFNEALCPNSDLYPCPKKDTGEIWTKYPIQWPNITEGSELDHPPQSPAAVRRMPPSGSPGTEEEVPHLELRKFAVERGISQR